MVKAVEEIRNGVDITHIDESVYQVTGSAVCKAKHVKLVLNDKIVEFEVDTAACATIMSKVMFVTLFKDCKLERVDRQLTSVTGNYLHILGKINVKVNNNEKLELIIIDSKSDFIPLLGRNWINIIYPKWEDFFEQRESKI